MSFDRLYAIKVTKLKMALIDIICLKISSDSARRLQPPSG